MGQAPLGARGYDNMPDKIIDDADQPAAHTFALKIDNS
jgi:hypothetical protein